MTGLRLGIALLAAAIAGGIVGAWITDARHERVVATAENTTAQANTRAPAAPSDLSAPASPPVFAPLTEDGKDFGEDADRAKKDPAFLRELIKRYLNEADFDARGALLATLQNVANDDVLRLAQQLLADPARHQDGLALLRVFPLDKPEARSLLISEMQRETDPAQLRQLVDMLTPAVMSTDDSAPVLERLAALRRNADPSVRASSVTQTIQWDKSGNLEDVLYTALLDPSPQVRQAAIGAAGVSSVRSERLKTVMLDILSNPRSGTEERNAALFTLQNFPLTRDEYAIYKQASMAANANSSEITY
ncbi:hypothetical protein [Luteimonas panaciterrae]|uniref:hypothetical protein n=1 Tax=Luteimonas panaciterrae TaxID=363885 RepID=UPI001CFBD093|nr:hypothetical protein [Luteimonas panaciterrae]